GLLFHTLVCSHVCMSGHMRTFMCTIRMYMTVVVCVCACLCLYSFLCVCVCVCVCVCLCVNVFIYILYTIMYKCRLYCLGSILCVHVTLLPRTYQYDLNTQPLTDSTPQ